MTEIHKCQCGFEWQHGMSGSHMCEPHYRKQIEALLKERDALAVEKNAELKSFDAAIANIQAQGVEMFADDCDSDSMLAEPEDTEHYVLMAEKAREFASKVRASKLEGDEQ